MAKITILCGSPNTDGLPRLMQRYNEVVGTTDEGSALWLTPGFRAREDIRRRLYSSPHLLTIQDFADEIVRAGDVASRPISNLQRRLILAEIGARLQNQGRLSHFDRVFDTHGFAEMMFATVMELKQNEIHPNRLEESFASNQFNDQEMAKDQQCALIYREYQKLLDDAHWYDAEGRFWRARDLLQRDSRSPFESTRFVFLHGFTNFTPPQHDMLNALCRWIDEMWIVLPDCDDLERGELFSPARRTLLRLASLFPTVDYCEADENTPMPTGLQHLQKQLFRPLKKVIRSTDAEGVDLIQAPGMVGEACLAARRIRQLLLRGAAPDDVLVLLRDAEPYADLVQEVFAEYRIPIDVEGTEALLRNPAVSTLLRAWRVPEDGFAFAPVTALLRSNYFRPRWPESLTTMDVAERSEALLHLLDEPRGRDTFLAAVQRWADKPQPGLEDEQAEESRRQHIHQLALECRPFLERFLHAWDEAPRRATLADHAAWLWKLAESLGIVAVANDSPRDRRALARFKSELESWLHLDRTIHNKERKIDHGEFDRLLHSVAVHAGLARTPRGAGRVRVLSALTARGLQADHVFLMGLGERGFPRMAPPETLFDERQRTALKRAGLDHTGGDDVLPDEMLLFYQAITSARKQLTLSYPAVDAKGQDLLPSSFLAALLDCIEPGAVPVERRNMLIEGFDSDTPLSPAEYRVQAALAGAEGRLPRGLNGQLGAARAVAHQRFHLADHCRFDGLFDDPQVIAQVGELFHAERIFSPTTLESYVACPFKFFAKHVLKLEPLEDPSEEIESTARGLAFHRALSRLHTQLRDDGIHQPSEEVEPVLLNHLGRAVKESTTQAGPAAEMLWRLEGERLKRSAKRYRGHWQKFLKPWQARKLQPQPEFFEVGFGLPPADGEFMAEPLVIRIDDVEARISGRIDRVDTVELPNGGGTGFWIIDYKTGRSNYYTGRDLKDFRKLQLTLYALAAETVLLTGRNARPLGLAYWLVTDKGASVAMPGYPRHLAWLDDAKAWQRIRQALQRWVVEIVKRIRAGEFALKPRSEQCTQTCDFSRICRISQCRATVAEKSWMLPLPLIEDDA